MPQLAHIDVGDAAQDITVGLGDGRYIVQVRAANDVSGVLYATSPAAPADDGDYFHCAGGDFFTFPVGATFGPTWAKAAVEGVAVILAIAPYEAS